MWDILFKIAAVIGILHYLKESNKGGCGCSGGGVVSAQPPKVRVGTVPIGGTRSTTDIPYGIASVASGKGIIEDSKTGRLGDAPYTGRSSA